MLPTDGDVDLSDNAELVDADTAESETAAEAENDPPIDNEGEAELVLDGDKDEPLDGDTDLDAESAADGETALEAESEAVPEAEPEAESQDGDSVEDDASVEQDEESGELEEEAPPLTCEVGDSIFANMTVVSEPRFSREGYRYNGKLTNHCQTDGFYFAGAAGMAVTVRFYPNTSSDQLIGRLAIFDVGAISHRHTPQTYFDQSNPTRPGELTYSFTLPYTGEYAVVVSSKDFRFKGNYGLEATCTANCETNFTRHPIVLMHGMAGFDKALGLLDYFNGVPGDLTNQGYVVYVTQAAMFNDSDARAREIETQLMDFLATTGARKLNLVVHSQGGLDARHIISAFGHGDDIATLTMVATPNRGTIVGDIVQGTLPGWSQDVIYAIIDFFSNLMETSENDTRKALKQVSVDYLQNEFNPAHPDDPRVHYYSWAGITCNALESDCRAAHSDEAVLIAMMPTYTIIRDAGPDTQIGCGTNDGMVPLNSAKWGDFMGTVDADHADEIGQMKTGNFDHIGFYRNIAGFLATENF